MVVDANTGRVLHADHENELRHPASITKVMTLYLLFEQLEKGRMSLDDEIPISSHAASMAPRARSSGMAVNKLPSGAPPIPSGP